MQTQLGHRFVCEAYKAAFQHTSAPSATCKTQLSDRPHAATGAPSVFNHGGAVGAGDLLRATRGEAIELDLTQPADITAERLALLLSDPASLALVGTAAAMRARTWTEAQNAAELTALLEEALA